MIPSRLASFLPWESPQKPGLSSLPRGGWVPTLFRGRATKVTEGEGQRRRCSCHWLTPHMGTTAKTRIPALHPGLPWQCQGPEHWAVLHCLGRAVSAKLRWEWSERGLSQLSHRRYQCCRQWLTPHVLMPALWPRIFARCLSSPSGTFLLPMHIPLRVFDQLQLLSVDQIPCLCGCSL